MTSLPDQFKTYLEGGKHLSASSIKNYVSDINLFVNWLKTNLQEGEVKPEQVTAASINAYRDYLNNSRQSLAAKNRHLSSLRRFGSFLVNAQLTATNPASHLINLDPAATTTTTKQMLKNFRAELRKQNLSPTTIKNYLSDVKQYLNWALDRNKSLQNNR